MRALLRKCELQRTVRCGDRGRVVPLEIVGLPVVQVDGGPVWVVAWVERPAVGVELVGEDEGVFGLAIGEGGAG